MRLAQMGQMRAILHAPEYQRLEAAWRGVHFLARRIETGPALKIFIADEGSAGEIPHAPRDLRWSVIVLDRAFGRSEESLDALRRLGAQAMAKNAALLAEAEPPGGDSGENARWAAFRRRPEALHIGLALPRLIARMPYGQSGETTEVFPFEEMDSAPAHSQYLWMNPAFGIAYLLAVAFERGGWRAMPGTVRDIDQLPLHVAKVNGEFAAKPCAELWLTESEIEQVLDAGLMAIASIRDTDRVKLVRLQCAAEPVCGIAGPWDRMS
jgi:type VI secretion system protein ImpC